MEQTNLVFAEVCVSDLQELIHSIIYVINAAKLPSDYQLYQIKLFRVSNQVN